MIPAAFVDGAVLAAMVLDDRRGEVLEGLAPGLARAVAERKAELDVLPRGQRHSRVRALVEDVSAIPSELEPRIAALLAGGQAEIDAGPGVRRGFRAVRGLRVTLRRWAWAELEESEAGSMHATNVGLDPQPARRRATERELALIDEAPWR